MAEELEIEEIQEEEPTEPEERQYAGKYTSVEELERGYKELERKLGSAAQPVQEAASDPGYVQLPAGTAQEAEDEEVPDDFYENPAKYVAKKVQEAVLQTIGQVRQIDRVAASNREAALREVREHPDWEGVRSEVELALANVDPAYLTDPAQARQIIRAVFGERLVERRSLVRPPYAAVRRARVEEALEQPDTSGNELEEDIDPQGDTLLKSLGLGPKDRRAVAKSWTNRQREERGSK